MKQEETLSAYSFFVELDGIETARFQKCEGLEAETETFEYEEGGGKVHHFQGRSRFPNLILEKGINDNNELFKWFQSITKDEKVERKNGSVVLKNNQGEEIKRWNFFRAFPCRWIGPKLDYKDPSTFAVERIEIAHEGLEVDNDAEIFIPPFELKQEDNEKQNDSELAMEKNRKNRLSQNALRPEKPNGPCYFRALVACVEEKTNENFTLEELKDIAAKAKVNDYIGNFDEYYFVNNPKEIIKIALEKKGYKNSTVTYKNRSEQCSGTSDFTIRYISEKGHFQLGDRKGNLLWEPYKYNNPENSFRGNASKYNEISIILGEKE